MEILVLDIETGNIDSKNIQKRFDVENCVICEIGIVNLNLDSGKIKPVFDHTCKEDILPDPDSWIFQNSSLTYKMIKESNHLKNFKDELQDIFNSKPVTSWNQKFDFNHLECHSRCLTIPSKCWDPMEILTDLIKIPHPFRDGYKWPSLIEGYLHFNPNKRLEHQHRAIDDAKIAAKTIFQALEKWPNLQELIP